MTWVEYTRIIIYGAPVATQRVRFDVVHKRAYKPSKTRSAMERRILFIKRHMAQNKLPKLENQPLRLDLAFYHPRPKRLLRKKSNPNAIPKTTVPDLDNLEKLIMDCLTQANVWSDDSLVTDKLSIDRWVEIDNQPRTHIIIYTKGE